MNDFTPTTPPAPGAEPPRPILCPAALVHDWLLGMRGGEWVLAALLRLMPLATVHTLFYDPRGVIRDINRRAIVPSGLNRLPGVRRWYRWLWPVLPAAVERLSIDPGARLVFATSHCVAHGVLAPAGAVHVNYYFSPMRYLYDQREIYEHGLRGRMLRALAPRLREWDRQAARRADHAWAISHFVARRVRQAFGIDPRVIYPPVRTDVFRPPAQPRRVDEDLLVSAMVPYKRVEVAIRAANRLGRPLRVIGGGPLLRAMRRLAGPTVALEGWVGEARLLELYQTRRALIFTAEEDFGIVPLEAMACGMPVLGLRAGGLVETLPEGRCGAFYDRPDAESLAEAWRAFDPAACDPAALRAHAERFGEDRFLGEVARALAAVLGDSHPPLDGVK